MSQTIEVKVPDIGDFHDVPVIEVLVAPGDSIKQEQALVMLESDKATLEVPSPVAGIVREVRLKLGDKVSAGTLVLLLETAENIPQPAPQPTPQASPQAPPQPRSHRPLRQPLAQPQSQDRAYLPHRQSLAWHAGPSLLGKGPKLPLVEDCQRPTSPPPRPGGDHDHRNRRS